MAPPSKRFSLQYSVSLAMEAEGQGSYLTGGRGIFIVIVCRIPVESAATVYRYSK